MILLPPNGSLVDLEKAIRKANTHIERTEVILKNLLALTGETDDFFTIPIEDVLTSIETALDTLKTM